MRAKATIAREVLREKVRESKKGRGEREREKERVNC